MSLADAAPSDRRSAGEQRNRRIALLSLLLLAPLAMAAVGWRDVAELQRKLELQPLDVPAGQRADYIGARLALTALDFLPSTAGVPADRTFARARVEVEAPAPSQDWLDCRLFLVDSQGRRWEEIRFAPGALERQFRKRDEAPASRCSALAVGAHQAGAKLMVDAYFLVPTAAIPSLRLTVSAMGGRPHYLRFAPEAAK